MACDGPSFDDRRAVRGLVNGNMSYRFENAGRAGAIEHVNLMRQSVMNAPIVSTGLESEPTLGFWQEKLARARLFDRCIEKHGGSRSAEPQADWARCPAGLIKRSTAIAVADLTERTSVKGRGHKGTQGSYEVTDRHPKMVGFAVVTPSGSSVLLVGRIRNPPCAQLACR